MIRVVHCKKEHYDIYIGRPSKFGNKFVIGKDGNRDEIIEKFREWAPTQSQIMDSLHELDNKILGCWCSPQRCHGDVLIELRERQESISRQSPES